MATLVGIKKTEPLSHTEKDIRVEGLNVLSKKNVVLCSLSETEHQKVASAFSMNTAQNGKLSIEVRATDGQEYELLFTTKFAY